MIIETNSKKNINEKELLQDQYFQNNSRIKK